MRVVAAVAEETQTQAEPVVLEAVAEAVVLGLATPTERLVRSIQAVEAAVVVVKPA